MANSQRSTGVLPRVPIPTTTGFGTYRTGMPLSDEMVAQIRAVWVRDLYELQQSLRPWYVRLWEWVNRGR
jgi:hypothetical protein